MRVAGKTHRTPILGGGGTLFPGESVQVIIISQEPPTEYIWHPGLVALTLEEIIYIQTFINHLLVDILSAVVEHKMNMYIWPKEETVALKEHKTM
jgi:hypothetical protein